MTGMFDAMRKAARKRRQYLDVLHQLQDLNERQLNDIGIQGHDIRRFARTAAQKN